jgi:hypothetical protein
MPLRINYMERICRSHDYKQWELSKLLSLQAGYEANGVFEYKHAYTFVYFLATMHFDVFKKLLLALRQGQYTWSKWGSITGISINETNKMWHVALNTWCAQPEHNTGPENFKCVANQQPDQSSKCAVTGHGFRKDHEEYSDLGESTSMEPSYMDVSAMSVRSSQVLRSWILEEQREKRNDERNIHIGTDLEDLLGPSVNHATQAVHLAGHDDDLLQF